MMLLRHVDRHEIFHQLDEVSIRIDEFCFHSIQCEYIVWKLKSKIMSTEDDENVSLVNSS